MKRVIKLLGLCAVLQACEIKTINYHSCCEHGIEKKTILNPLLRDTLAGTKL